MSGSEIQGPFSLGLQASSIHSGSVSFGRFEKEGISWEKRSSFSHNRYLEEVDKCSKPGSVTEMKAHFEAHFKKKGILFPNSLESQTWGVRQTSEPDDATESFEDYRSDGSFTSHSESPCNYRREQEECDNFVSYDEIVVNSDDVIELDEEHGNLSVPLVNDEVLLVECLAIKEDSCDNLGQEEIEVLDDVEETEPRLNQHVPKKASDVMERSSSACGPKSLPNAKPIIPHVTKASTKRHDVIPKAASRRTKGSSKTNVDAKSQKELRPNKTVESRPPTSKKIETRTPLATNRSKTGTFSAKLEMSTRASGFPFKCSERAEKRKEFYVKLEEKMHAKKTETNQVQSKTQQKSEAEMKQFRKSLNFKATPMPSFYNKTEPSKVVPSRPRHTTPASVTNRAVARVGYKHGLEEAKLMVGNTKQNVAKDSDLQKGNLMAVETKKKTGT